jgi:hypothetical protein
MTGAAAAVILCALDLLGRSPKHLPPIELVERAPPGGSSNVEGYVITGQNTIFVVTSTWAYRDAECNNRRSLLKLASILVHEEWHIRHGPDERGAYEAQLRSLILLGEGPDTALYHSVYRAMRHVLSSRLYALRLRAIEGEARLAAEEQEAARRITRARDWPDPGCCAAGEPVKGSAPHSGPSEAR